MSHSQCVRSFVYRSPAADDASDMMDEKCVMNSYFGIGIDAKITLDFHMKREEHPEKCRSRARNYMWYGVLGSKEWLQASRALFLFFCA